MSIPRRLLTYLNSGKCFALIGSGLSTGMGYPSWKTLALDAARLLASDKREKPLLVELIEKQDYPEVFERVADRIGGGLPALLNHLRKTCVASRHSSKSYEYICRWPIRCYLTTNYEDEISAHLQKSGQHFTTLHNSQHELAQITSESSRRIVKLHGSFDTPDDIVLTTSQYTSFETGGERAYFRNKLTSIFQMVPVVVIGHSMSDRDLRLVLQCAKESASPEKPTFVILADASPAEVDKFYKQYNIHLLSYPNPDGTHSNLVYLLRQIDRFVIPRSAGARPPLDFPDAKEAEAAVSLYVHSSLGFGVNAPLLQRTIQPQLLAVVAEQAPKSMSLESAVMHIQPESLRNYSEYQKEASDAAHSLAASGLITTEDGQLKATLDGLEHLKEITSKRESEEDQFFGAFRSRLAAHGSKNDVNALVGGFKRALLGVFRRRGLAAAELLFRANPFEPPDMPELFESVFPPAAIVADFALRAEYCDAVMDILVHPNEEQRAYLAHLAQGFFAFHMFGLDPTGQETRRRLVQGTVWILDSNILMPLVAKECEQHEMMRDLVARLTSLGIRPITTHSFVEEVNKSMLWTERQLRDVADGDERQRLLEVVGRPGYSDNPFVDGFIQGCVNGHWRTFSEYKEQVSWKDSEKLSQSIESYGVQTVNPFAHWTVEDTAAVDSLTTEIYAERERAGTIRAGEVQASAEAEALYLIRDIRANGFGGASESNRAFFVSTSRLLDVLYKDRDGLLTWFPETLYKHLQYLDAEKMDVEKVFEAISTSYFTAGVTVVDEATYRQYFKPAVTEASAILEKEVANYARAVSASVEDAQKETESILSHFRRTPDLEKPVFVAQLGWLAARRAERRAEVAEAARRDAEAREREKVKAIKDEYARKERERRRHEEGRRKNLGDPKHLRKRLRQAKERRKKRKGN